MNPIQLYEAFDGTVFKDPATALGHENNLIRDCIWKHHPNKYDQDQVPMDKDHKNWALKWMFEYEWYKVKRLDVVEMRNMNIDV